MISAVNAGEGVFGSGAAYLFDATSGDFRHKLIAPDAVIGDQFGISVALDGNNALIGSRLDDDNGTDSGSAYLFDVDDGDFRQKLLAPDGAAFDQFSWSVALDGDNALIGAITDDDNGNSSGSAYLFDANSGDFRQKLIAPDGTNGDMKSV